MKTKQLACPWENEADSELEEETETEKTLVWFGLPAPAASLVSLWFGSVALPDSVK